MNVYTNGTQLNVLYEIILILYYALQGTKIIFYIDHHNVFTPSVLYNILYASDENVNRQVHCYKCLYKYFNDFRLTYIDKRVDLRATYVVIVLLQLFIFYTGIIHILCILHVQLADLCIF